MSSDGPGLIGRYCALCFSTWTGDEGVCPFTGEHGEVIEARAAIVRRVLEKPND